MRLAANETRLTIDRATATLKPSLRAAYRLIPDDDALPDLLRGVLDFDYGIISRVIRESATDKAEGSDLIEALTYGGLAHNHAAIAESLTQHVIALLGMQGREHKTEPTSEIEAPRVSFSEYFEDLYRIATGWLGWPPEAAWNATPAEILEAYAGRKAMLTALFGSASPSIDNSPHFERDENAIGELKALVAMGANRMGG